MSEPADVAAAAAAPLLRRPPRRRAPNRLPTTPWCSGKLPALAIAITLLLLLLLLLAGNLMTNQGR